MNVTVWRLGRISQTLLAPDASVHASSRVSSQSKQSLVAVLFATNLLMMFTERMSHPNNVLVRRRRKTEWEQSLLAENDVYACNLRDVCTAYPQLTPSEARVAALVMAALPSWRIAELLFITEKTVENHRIKIRKKLGCVTHLSVFLQRKESRSFS